MSRRFGLDPKTDSKDAEMAQRKEKEPCSGTALMVTKNDFYYTVIRCIGLIFGAQSSSLDRKSVV